jgi:hypothetical protein
MKELEKMKELWKEVHEENNNYEQLYKEQIMKNLSLKSNSVFVRLSRSVKFEYMAIATSIPVMLIPLTYISNANFRWSSIAFTVIMALYGLLFWNDFRTIENYSLNSGNLSEQLSESIGHLEKFVKKYFRASIAMWPMVGVVYYFIIIRYLQNEFSPNEFSPIALGLSIVIATFIGYFVQKWYTQKMYGKYVDELKSLQKELQTEV